MTVADPGWRRPLQAVQPDRGIAGQGLAGQPELIAGPAVQLASGGLDGGFRAVRGETVVPSATAIAVVATALALRATKTFVT